MKQASTKFYLLSILAIAISFSLLAFVKHIGEKETLDLISTNTVDNNGFAVVELFTSEGCSSCPAADVVLEKISKEYKDNVYVLGFHVDYWNRLGWKDEFSSAAYSERQGKYAELFKLDGAYTPQVVVNGKAEFVGSNESKLITTINAALKGNASTKIDFFTKVNNNTVNVNYTVDANAKQVINFALVQLHTLTNVKRGENAGRQLQHINIVRDFKTVDTDAKEGTVSLSIPSTLTTKECKVIAYTQDKSSFATLGAIERIID